MDINIILISFTHSNDTALPIQQSASFKEQYWCEIKKKN